MTTFFIAKKNHKRTPDGTPLCDDCGLPMTLAPGIDYFCENDACASNDPEIRRIRRQALMSEMRDDVDYQNYLRLRKRYERGEFAEAERRLTRASSSEPLDDPDRF